MNRLPILRLGLAVVVLWNLDSPAQVLSSTDAWDVSQGATMTAFSGWSKYTTENTLPNMFGSDIAVVSPFSGLPWPGESGAAFFAEDQPAGFVHWIEWSTPAEVQLMGYNLAANASNFGGYDGTRGFSEFRLYIRNETTLGYDLVDSFSPSTPNYYETFSRTFAPVAGREFRAEFVQYAPAESGAPGPRIRELDAIAVPEPSTFVMISGAALFCFAVWRKTPLPKA